MFDICPLGINGTHTYIGTVAAMSRSQFTLFILSSRVLKCLSNIVIVRISMRSFDSSINLFIFVFDDDENDFLAIEWILDRFFTLLFLSLMSKKYFFSLTLGSFIIAAHQFHYFISNELIKSKTINYLEKINPNSKNKQYLKCLY